MSHNVSSKLNDYIRYRDGGICIYCLDEIGQVIDHVIPVVLGGPTISSNLVLACNNCNMIKKGHLIEFFLKLAFKHLLTVGENLDWVDNFIPIKTHPLIFKTTPIDNILDQQPVIEENYCLWCHRLIYPEDDFCSINCTKDFAEEFDLNIYNL